MDGPDQGRKRTKLKGKDPAKMEDRLRAFPTASISLRFVPKVGFSISILAVQKKRATLENDVWLMLFFKKKKKVDVRINIQTWSTSQLAT